MPGAPVRPRCAPIRTVPGGQPVGLGDPRSRIRAGATHCRGVRFLAVMPDNDLARRLRDQLAAHPAPQDPQAWITARLPRTGYTGRPIDDARDALGISEEDAAAVLDAGLLPEQLMAALDQLSDGASTINWEAAYAAAYGLEDGDFQHHSRASSTPPCVGSHPRPDH